MGTTLIPTIKVVETEFVKSFNYLGYILANTRDLHEEIYRCIYLAMVALNALWKLFWWSPSISRATKMNVCSVSTCCPTLQLGDVDHYWDAREENWYLWLVLPVDDQACWVAGTCCKLWNMGSNIAAAGTWIDHQTPSTLVWTPRALLTDTPNPCMLQNWPAQWQLEVTKRCTTHSLASHHQRLRTEPETRPRPTWTGRVWPRWWRFLLAIVSSMPNGTSQWWCWFTGDYFGN